MSFKSSKAFLNSSFNIKKSKFKHLVTSVLDSESLLEIALSVSKDINLKLNFFESDFDVTLKSKMINGLSNSKILDIFNPIINIKNSEIEVEIISESSELNYGTEELFIPSKIIFKGMYLNQPFTGEADEMNFYFLENRVSFSKNLMIIFDEKEYKGQNIEINTKDKSIMGSDKISINKINDFKSKKDL